MPKISEERRQERRAEIEAAASRCFAATGFQATTMDDIVAESGISLGGIYRYFSSKDEIVQSIARQRHAIELQLLLDALDDTNLEDAFASAFAVLLTGDPELERRRLVVHLWGEALRDDVVHQTVLDGVNAPVEALSAYLQENIDLPPAVPTESTARVLVSIVLGLIAQQAWDPSLDTRDYAAAASTLIANGLVPRPSPRR